MARAARCLALVLSATLARSAVAHAQSAAGTPPDAPGAHGGTGTSEVEPAERGVVALPEVSAGGGASTPASGASSGRAGPPRPGTPYVIDLASVDVVTLRDGSVLRGYVAELHPGRSCSFVVLTGETRELPWSEIVRATGPGFGAPATGRGALVTSEQGMPPPPPGLGGLSLDDAEYLTPSPGRVPVEVLSVNERQIVGVVIARANNAGGLGAQSAVHHDLCRTPCTLFVRPGLFSMYTGGEGTLDHFSDLDVPPTGMRVLMRRGQRSAVLWGVTLTVSAVIFGLAGGSLLLVGGILAAGSARRTVADDLLEAGTWLSVPSVALSVLGIYILVANRTGPERVTPLRPAGPSAALVPVVPGGGSGLGVGVVGRF